MAWGTKETEIPYKGAALKWYWIYKWIMKSSPFCRSETQVFPCFTLWSSLQAFPGISEEGFFITCISHTVFRTWFIYSQLEAEASTSSSHQRIVLLGNLFHSSISPRSANSLHGDTLNSYVHCVCCCGICLVFPSGMQTLWSLWLP